MASKLCILIILYTLNEKINNFQLTRIYLKFQLSLNVPDGWIWIEGWMGVIPSHYIHPVVVNLLTGKCLRHCKSQVRQ